LARLGNLASRGTVENASHKSILGEYGAVRKPLLPVNVNLRIYVLVGITG